MINYKELYEAICSGTTTYRTEAVKMGMSPEQLRSKIRRWRQRNEPVPYNAVDPMRYRNDVNLLEDQYVPALPPPPVMTQSFGLIGDTHLCSSYEELEALHAMYDIFYKEGIRNVYHTGNYIDGESRVNFSDIHVHGLEAQVTYFVKNYPHRPGITTHYVAGDDHEGWYQQRNSISIGRYTEDVARYYQRNDLKYLGYMEADVPLLNGHVLRVVHAGGGSSYAISHTSQKIVDYLEYGVKPLIMAVGHYHKAEFLPDYKGVYVVQTGAFQSTTPFMRKKRLTADIGGWIVHIKYTDPVRVSAEFVRFPSTKWQYRNPSDKIST